MEKIIVDGIPYDDISQAPDMGSLIGTGTASERNYSGFWEDADKLPIRPELKIADANLIEPDFGLHYCLLVNKHWYDGATGQMIK